MTILTLTDMVAATIDWQFVTLTETFASPYTGDEQSASFPAAARWLTTLTFPKRMRDEAAEFEADLVELLGPAGRFYLGNQARRTPRGSALGTPVVDGAANYGGLLATRGWPPNTAGLLLRGDYIGVNNELKMVVAAVNSDAAGKATLVVRPFLRSVPADGTAVVTVYPKSIFRLLDDNQVKFAYRKQTGDYQITAVETWS